VIYFSLDREYLIVAETLKSIGEKNPNKVDFILAN
jgi:hypothetical protein